MVRYEAQYLPAAVRRLYQEYAADCIGRVQVGSPVLAATRYNWSEVIPL